MKSCFLRSEKHAVKARKLLAPEPILCHFKRYTFYVCAWAPREQITPSVQPRPHSKTSLLRIPVVPNRCRKFATNLLRPIPRIPFLPLAHVSRRRSRFPILLWLKKLSRARGIDDPLARLRAWLLPPAAESLCLRRTENIPQAAQRSKTAVRGWRVITSPCDASAVRRRRRLWRLCPASNRGCLSYLDQDFVFRSF